MAYPYSVPLVAGGADPFGALAAQREFYVGLNARQSEANLARAAQAEAVRNNWLRTMAELESGDQYRDEAAQQRAYELALSRGDTARQEAESKRRFEVQSELSQEEQAIRRDQYKAQRKEREQAKEQAQEAMATVADAKKDDVATFGSLHEDALRELNDAQAELKQRGEELAAQIAPGKVAFNERTGTLGVVRGQFPSPDLNPKIADANQKLAELATAKQAAINNFSVHSKNWQQLVGELENKWHLTVTKEGDQYVIVDPLTGTRYKGSKPTKAAAADTGAAEVPNPLQYWSSGLAPLMSGEAVAPEPGDGAAVVPWAGLNAGVNLAARPAVSLPDGRVATVRSIGVGDERGEWVIPTIVGGQPVSNKEAIRLWRAGQNPALGGPFNTQEEADAFAQQFHEQEARRIGSPESPAGVSFENEPSEGIWSGLLRSGDRALMSVPRAAIYTGGKIMEDRPEDRTITWAGLRQAAFPPAVPPPRPLGKTHVRSPDGTTGWIPTEQLPLATSQGYQVID